VRLGAATERAWGVSPFEAAGHALDDSQSARDPQAEPERYKRFAGAKSVRRRQARDARYNRTTIVFAGSSPVQDVQRRNMSEALAALRTLLNDPSDTAQGFRLIEAIDPHVHHRELARMRGDLYGRRLLAECPVLLHALLQRRELEALPEGSLGRAYRAHCVREGIDPEQFVRVAEAGSRAAQTRSPGLLLLFLGGIVHSWMVGSESGRTMRRLAWRGFKSGLKALPLAAAPWEEWLDRPLTQVRADLQIDDVPRYQPVYAQQRGSLTAAGR
jgi:ubiquinone biosynthesis protein Coq4